MATPTKGSNSQRQTTPERRRLTCYKRPNVGMRNARIAWLVANVTLSALLLAPRRMGSARALGRAARKIQVTPAGLALAD
jgi:hypothetical protein